jgi:hypothetical protein
MDSTNKNEFFNTLSRMDDQGYFLTYSTIILLIENCRNIFMSSRKSMSISKKVPMKKQDYKRTVKRKVVIYEEGKTSPKRKVVWAVPSQRDLKKLGIEGKKNRNLIIADLEEWVNNPSKIKENPEIVFFVTKFLIEEEDKKVKPLKYGRKIVGFYIDREDKKKPTLIYHIPTQRFLVKSLNNFSIPSVK